MECENNKERNRGRDGEKKIERETWREMRKMESNERRNGKETRDQG